MLSEAELREDALHLIKTGIEAVDPEKLVAGYLKKHRKLLPGKGAVHVAALGKAAPAMARGAAAFLGERMVPGPLVRQEDDYSRFPQGFRTFRAGHPVPNSQSMEGAGAIRDLARRLGAKDRLLVLISGGGSALATLPSEAITLFDLNKTTELMMRAGADIGQLNCVRKHLEDLKGGRLARHAAPTPTVGLVLSDVVGDALDVVASGPLSPDPTTFDRAIETLRELGIWEAVPGLVRRHLKKGAVEEELETPKPGDPCFQKVKVELVGNNRIAVEAILAEAEALGYEILLLSTQLTGEARYVGRVLAAIAREVRESGNPIPPRACIVAGGETTVTVRGRGRGGRNQELALAAAIALEGVEGALVASVGTDGRDGPTGSAGAMATGTTLERSRRYSRDPHKALANNDSNMFFSPLDDLVMLGPTGTNVMDVQVILVG